MRPLRRIAFVAKEIRVGSPGQQLLDRFLVGYNLSGVFHAPGCRVTIAGVDRNAELAARARDFGLELSDSVKEAVGGADGVVLVPRAANWRRDRENSRP